MASGRCAGCGRTGSACRVNTHIAECPGWLELYRKDPSLALDAESEYKRWKDQDQAGERDARREHVMVTGEAARSASLARFRYRDILADSEDDVA